MIKKTMFKFGIFLLVAVLLSSMALGFGVSSPYSLVTIAPGETKITYLILQNMIGGEDITIKAGITQGGEIASIVGKDEYLVKLGTKDTKVPIKISIPENISVNTTYRVVVSFLTVTPGQGGGVAFETGINQGISVFVTGVKEEKPVNFLLIAIIIAVLILILIIIIVLMLRRKKERRFRR